MFDHKFWNPAYGNKQFEDQALKLAKCFNHFLFEGFSSVILLYIYMVHNHFSTYIFTSNVKFLYLF